MKLPIFQVDAFTSQRFAGNPAAVVVLDDWLPDATMQSIAAENNLSETAFVVPRPGPFGLRWFTPESEVDLCGHATLASAHVVLRHGSADRREVTFDTKSGKLTVRDTGERLAMDLPSRPPEPRAIPPGVVAALGATPSKMLESRDLLAVFDSEDEVAALAPDFRALAALDVYAIIATAPGSASDFVSRFFAPKVGIDEDPVTGSAHCTLVPYWSARLGRPRLHALQISRRGGELHCEHRGDRIELAGSAVDYLCGEISI